MSQKFGLLPVLIAILVTMILTYIILSSAEFIHKILGNRLTEVMSRVFGLLLAALSIEFIRVGIVEMIQMLQ